jgi:hypothetical protein
MATFNGISTPLRSILSSGPTFARFADKGVDTTLPRLLFCALQGAGMLYALSKLNSMGLLPTHASDWLPYGVFLLRRTLWVAR